jgi:uncharacterized protein
MPAKPRRNAPEVLLFATLTISAFVTVSSGAASAQSFDCEGKLSSIESRICEDPSLSGLDFDLERVFQQVLKVSGDGRNALLVEQRGWVKQRDVSCAAPAAIADKNGRRLTPTPEICLDKEYRARIDELGRRLPNDAASRKTPCQQIVDAYSTAIARNPKVAYDARPEFAGLSANPIAIVSTGKDAVVSLLGPIAEDSGFHDIANFNRWSQAQSPPFRAPSHGWNVVDATLPDTISVDHLPATNVYSLTSIAGTLSCYQGTFILEARRGEARYISAPENWIGEKIGETCSVNRQFGTVSGEPAAVQIGRDEYEWLKQIVSVAPWDGDRFGHACRAIFEFAPLFLPRRISSWGSGEPNDACRDETCRRMQQMVLSLMPGIEKNPVLVRAEALAKLDEAQRRRFFEIMAGENPEPNDPTCRAENEPLSLPLVVDGVVYDATICHTRVRDFTLPDWEVTLDARAPGDRGDSYSFPIGMGKGRLVRAYVE